MCFSPDDTISIAHMNLSGLVHKKQVPAWGDIYIKLKYIYNKTDGKCTVDSAFGKIYQIFNKVLTQSSDFIRQHSERECATNINQSSIRIKLCFCI